MTLTPAERAAAVMASLKDFQRASVEYAFDRLYTSDDGVSRFLVADEVGLGKTMVAKGVIAKAVEHLARTQDRINVVYICSNLQIAKQNLRRLNVVGGRAVEHADRLTLLPRAMKSLQSDSSGELPHVNFVSFTPGTSFHVGQAGGAAPERVLLYWMLAKAWGSEITGSVRWRKFFQGNVGPENFRRYLRDFQRHYLKDIDDEMCARLGAAVDAATGPGGRPLRTELEECAEKFTYLRRRPESGLHYARFTLIGALRSLLAHVAVDQLEPDLVVLDEFQNFSALLRAEAADDGARLARAVFDHPRARVLLLSATPYKMYTLPDEPSGEDHYRDFTQTVRFLAGAERTAVVERDLRALREALVAGGPLDEARAARDRVEHELRRVMSRTERLSSTPDRDGMLVAKDLPGMRLDAHDIHAWRTFDAIARHVDRHDVFEYWRSAPYALNLMEKSTYAIRRSFEAAADAGDAELTRLLDGARGLLDWQDVLRYRQIDPGNAKLRGLSHDVLDSGAWQLAWLPPSLPYYTLDGAYADERLRTFTKRLVFSAWAVVPKAIAVMLSYEAERRTLAQAGIDRDYTQVPAAPLQFRTDQSIERGTVGRLASMPVLSLLYPSVELARLGDPLAIAREAGEGLPLDRERLLQIVRDQLRPLVENLRPRAGTEGADDQRWYWAVPFFLDRQADPARATAFERTMNTWSDDRSSSFYEHIQRAHEIEHIAFGPMPADVVDVVAELAVGGPAVCALRALSRVTGGADALADAEVRDAAHRVAQGLRTLFNKPEIVALVRAQDDASYWRAALSHCVTGGLQPVLDEYAHMLVESEGLQDSDRTERASRVAERMVEALSMRTAMNVVEDIRVVDDQVRREDHRIGSHFAARYGRTQHDGKTAQRESHIRTSFNSPFRPFVLASTSVGQEGLDFHTYSHAIVHWNLPHNPVDLEQREGRVHRYKGHAVRKNVAADFGNAALDESFDDPWAGVFAAAVDAVAGTGSDITPFWVYTRPDGAVIERYVPAMPLSRETQRYEQLQRSVGAYRMVIGQPRQDDLIKYVGEDADWLRIDLTPGSRDVDA